MVMRIVYDTKGVYVQGLAERSGRRYIRVREPSNGHGGPQKNGDHSIAHLKRTTLMHADLKEIRTDEIEMREAGSIMTDSPFLDEIVYTGDHDDEAMM